MRGSGHAAQVGKHPLASGRYLRIRKHEVGVHALEHARGCFADVASGEGHFFDDAAQIGEPAAVMGAQHGFVAHPEVFKHVHHVVPALYGQQRVVQRERLRFLRRLLAIAIVRRVQIGDASRLAQRFDEERVVRPAGARVLAKADSASIEKLLAIDSRPNGRVVGQQMRRIADCKRLPAWLDAVAVAAVKLALLGSVGHPDAPVRGLHDVHRAVKRCCEAEHVGVHAGLDPVVGLDDGYPGAVRLLKTAVAGCAVALVLLVDDADALIAIGVCLHDGKRTVGAAVVEADDVELAVRLRQNAVEALFEIRLGVEYGNDDGKVRWDCFHAIDSFEELV